MKMDEAKQTVAGIINDKKTATVQEIIYATNGSVAAVQLYSVLSSFVKAGALLMDDTDGTKRYTLVDATKFGVELPDTDKKKNKKKDVKSEPEADQSKPAPTEAAVIDKTAETKKESRYVPVSTRDTSLFRFNKEDRGKGQTALAVVRAYVNDKSATLAQVKEAFPDKIVGRYGVTESLTKAKEHDRQRYFTKDEQVITTSDKKKVAVTNQWDTTRFLLFIEASKKAGYKITRVEK